MRKSFAALLTAEQKEKIQKGRGHRPGEFAVPPNPRLAALGLTEEQMAEVKEAPRIATEPRWLHSGRKAPHSNRMQEQLKQEESSPPRSENSSSRADVRQQIQKARESARESFAAVADRGNTGKTREVSRSERDGGRPHRHRSRGRL